MSKDSYLAENLVDSSPFNVIKNMYDPFILHRLVAWKNIVYRLNCLKSDGLTALFWDAIKADIDFVSMCSSFDELSLCDITTIPYDIIKKIDLRNINIEYLLEKKLGKDLYSSGKNEMQDMEKEQVFSWSNVFADMYLYVDKIIISDVLNSNPIKDASFASKLILCAELSKDAYRLNTLAGLLQFKQESLAYICALSLPEDEVILCQETLSQFVIVKQRQLLVNEALSRRISKESTFSDKVDFLRTYHAEKFSVAESRVDMTRVIESHRSLKGDYSFSDETLLQRHGFFSSHMFSNRELFAVDVAKFYLQKGRVNESLQQSRLEKSKNDIDSSSVGESGFENSPYTFSSEHSKDETPLGVLSLFARSSVGSRKKTLQQGKPVTDFTTKGKTILGRGEVSTKVEVERIKDVPYTFDTSHSSWKKNAEKLSDELILKPKPVRVKLEEKDDDIANKLAPLLRPLLPETTDNIVFVFRNQHNNIVNVRYDLLHDANTRAMMSRNMCFQLDELKSLLSSPVSSIPRMMPSGC